MCHFITATLPKDADLEKSAEVFNAYQLRFKEMENESVREHLEKGDYYIFTTKGICDCGTVLASQDPKNYQPDETDAPEYIDKVIEKLRAKGWSDAKISRWQKESELNDEKTKREEAQTHEQAMTSAEDWVNFIQDILSSKATKRIGILVHEYKGSLDSRIEILGKETVPLKKLGPKFLVEMHEDVIYDFVL